MVFTNYLTCATTKSIRLVSRLLLITCCLPWIDGLKCYVCSHKENPMFTVDVSETFRIVDELTHDYCRYLDEVHCDRDQDVCVTIIQYKIDDSRRQPRSYSVSKGCFQSSALDLSGQMYKKGCHKETSEVKEDISNAQFRSRRINIHPAMKYTCVCNSNKCNSANSNFHIQLFHLHKYRTSVHCLMIIMLMILLIFNNQ